MSNSVQSTPWAFKTALCLLAPYFYLAVHFSVAGSLPKGMAFLVLLAPLPILYLFLGITDGSARKWAYTACAMGLALCLATSGLGGALGFLLLASLPAIVLGEGLLRGLGIAKVVTMNFAILAAIGGIAVISLGDRLESELVPQMRQTATQYFTKVLEDNREELSEPDQKFFQQIIENPDRWLWKVPGGILVALEILSVLSLLILLRWNPKGLLYRIGLSRDYLRRWKTPEWLIWPALLCIATQVQPLEPLSIAGEILGWPIVFLYFLQGISILSFYLDLFRVRGPLRALFYGIALFPAFGTAVVSFGFFDLWLDFRSRARPAKRKNK